MFSIPIFSIIAAMMFAATAAQQFPRRELAIGRCTLMVRVMGSAVLQRPAATSPLGRLLKEWRGRRGFSQLDLALAARTTQRHVSFIESGRATASREMILRLAATMDVPLRQQNALLLAGGYAPAWSERGLGEPAMAIVSGALDHMLAQQEPFPAFVVDRRWNLLRANAGAVRLTEFLLGPLPATDEPVNLAIALMSSEGLRPFIANWPEVALYFLRGVQADAQSDGTHATAELLARLMALPDVASLSEGWALEEGQPPVLPIFFRQHGIELRLFTTIATLGTPRDVTAQEIRIECFFPADDSTASVFRGWETA
jgi:transcriptional regulator with XRE-family HTH domain